MRGKCGGTEETAKHNRDETQKEKKCRDTSMTKQQMRPIFTADVIEHTQQEAKNQDQNTSVNCHPQNADDILHRTDPGRFEMEM